MLLLLLLQIGLLLKRQLLLLLRQLVLLHLLLLLHKHLLLLSLHHQLLRLLLNEELLLCLRLWASLLILEGRHNGCQTRLVELQRFLRGRRLLAHKLTLWLLLLLHCVLREHRLLLLITR